MAAGAADALTMIRKMAPETPEGMGLMAVAYGEARNVERHTRYAASKPDDLDWIRAQAGHVMHAIEPKRRLQGRGLGYGLKKALAGISLAVGRAVGADDATDGFKTHAGHVVAAVSDSMARTDVILKLADQIEMAPDPVMARPLMLKLREQSLLLLSGTDLNRDGKTSWTGGEGGLDQIALHLQLMADQLAK